MIKMEKEKLYENPSGFSDETKKHYRKVAFVIVAIILVWILIDVISYMMW